MFIQVWTEIWPDLCCKSSHILFLCTYRVTFAARNVHQRSPKINLAGYLCKVKVKFVMGRNCTGKKILNVKHAHLGSAQLASSQNSLNFKYQYTRDQLIANDLQTKNYSEKLFDESLWINFSDDQMKENCDQMMETLWTEKGRWDLLSYVLGFFVLPCHAVTGKL